MSDRTVAEVMGFTSGHRLRGVGAVDCILCGKPPERWRVEYCPNGAEQPTPDDMLSWLREQGYDIEIGTAHDATEVGVEISRWDDWHEHTVADDYYASTLHAALEAAVLAVAAER